MDVDSEYDACSVQCLVLDDHWANKSSVDVGVRTRMRIAYVDRSNLLEEEKFEERKEKLIPRVSYLRLFDLSTQLTTPRANRKN